MYRDEKKAPSSGVLRAGDTRKVNQMSTTQITSPTGAELRDEGMANIIAADVAPHKMAGKFIKATIEEYAASGREFTADDVREALKDNPTVVRELAAKPNLLPAYMGTASHTGLIHAVGMYRPSRASRRASRNLVWIGGEAA